MKVSEGFSPVSADDHAGQLWIVTILAAIYTLTIAFIRIKVKWGMFGADDYLNAVAVVSILFTRFKGRE